MTAAGWRRALPWLCVAAVALLGLAFFGVACSTAWARIAALSTIEPYAMAVHEQLLFNFGRTGEFFQTIHTGYTDAWTWSGHRAGTLPLVAGIYRFYPTPYFLAELQIVFVTAGVIPAAAIGRRAFRHPAGMLVGALLYLGCPAVMALALQDYQDLVLAVPLLMVSLWALRAQRPWLLALGVLAGCLPREECLPLVVAAAMVSFDPRWERPWRRWGRNLAITACVVAAYAALIWYLSPRDGHSYQLPLASAPSAFFDPAQQVKLFGWSHIDSFYSLAWAPLGLIGLLAPLVALPGLAFMLLHMTIPWGLGVDRSWSAHAHHVAPMVPFFVVAAIYGAARARRLLRHPRLGRARALLPWLVGGAALLWLAVSNLGWARDYNLVQSLWPRWPELHHPAWDLVAQLPSDAVPIVPLDVSLAVSSRPRSYTFSESLQDKAPGWGLAAGSHLIVHSDNEAVLAWGLAMPGVELVAEAPPYQLLRWPAGSRDPRVGWWEDPPTRIPSVHYELVPEGLAPGVPPAAEAAPQLPILPPPERE